MTKLSEIGEFGLIDLIAKDLINNPSGVVKGVGDDTAVLETGGGWTLFTTDMMVEGVHFSFGYSSPRQVGWKALAVNISDIAAMGGRPSHALLSVAVPPGMGVDRIAELYEGLKEAARLYRVNIVGGDTVSNPERLVINVALLGEVEPGRAVYRSGARPGDRVYVTGALGAAAAGLFLFQNPHLRCSPGAASYCRLAHCEPRPRVAAGQVLAACRVSSLDDISDGLASEMHEICSASGTGCRIIAADVPVDPRVREVAGGAGVDPLEWALFGGEDFELVFSVAPELEEVVREAASGAGFKIHRVGEITAAGEGLSLEMPGGETRPLHRRGYDHFREREAGGCA